MPVTISALALRLVAPHVSGEGNRPLLSCLNLEAGGLLVATDGHTLAAYPDAHDSPTDLLLRCDWRKVLTGKVQDDDTILIEMAPDGCSFTARNPASGIAFPGTVGDGTYPAWRASHRELADWPGNTACFRPALLTRFTSLLPARLRDGMAVALYGTGGVDKAYRVALAAYPTFYGLAMPFRVPADLPTTPEFVAYRPTPSGVAE